MTGRGRPRTPTEVKRRRGTSRPDRDADPATVVALPMAHGVPDFPDDLEEAGREIWRRIWSTGLSWISPDSDVWAVEAVCKLADDVAIARERYRATRDPKDGRMVATFNSELHKALAVLGFNPSARSALGVAEVKKMSKLEEMLASKASRTGGS